MEFLMQPIKRIMVLEEVNGSNIPIALLHYPVPVVERELQQSQAPKLSMEGQSMRHKRWWRRKGKVHPKRQSSPQAR